jgi:hypothetical protein
MHLLIWILALFALALWSLFAWAAYAVLTIDPAQFGDVGAWVERAAAEVPGAAMLDQWWPGWRALLRFALESSQAALGLIAGVAPWLVGVLWAIGALALLAGAALASLLWSRLRPRRAAPPSAP